MLTEDYCSYEIAKLLKEKGFDGDGGDCECHMFYCDYTEERIMPICEIGLIPDNEEAFFAPTYQMAMKWLREVHNIFILIEPHSYNYIKEKNSSYVFSFWQGDNYCENPLLKEYYSYEDAVEAALKYSLENLI